MASDYAGIGTGLIEGFKARADVGLTRAKTAETNVDTATKQIELDARKRLMDQSGQPDTRSLRPSEQFADLASKATTLGAYDYAGKLIQMASHASTTERNQIDAILKRNKYIDEKLGGVKSQGDWEAAITDFESTFGKPAPELRQILYSPENVQRMRAGLQTSNEAAQIQTQQARRTRYTVQDKLTEAQTALAEARRKNVDERTKRLDKVGKPSGSPREGDQAAAKTIILNLHPEMGSNKSSLAEASYSIAAQAKTLQAKNPGLDMDMALRQAVRMEEEAGSFQTTSSTVPIIGVEYDKKGKFVGGGKTPADALPPPTDMKKLAPNKYYHNANGDVGLWDGKKMRMLNPSDYGSNTESLDNAGP